MVTVDAAMAAMVESLVMVNLGEFLLLSAPVCPCYGAVSFAQPKHKHAKTDVNGWLWAR
jgi:hypothetical protein